MYLVKVNFENELDLYAEDSIHALIMDRYNNDPLYYQLDVYENNTVVIGVTDYDFAQDLIDLFINPKNYESFFKDNWPDFDINQEIVISLKKMLSIKATAGMTRF